MTTPVGATPGGGARARVGGRAAPGWLGWWAALVTALLLAVVGATTAAAQDLQPLPDLRSPVTDLTGTLRPEQVRRLDEKLRAFEARKGSQIAIVLVPTTAPETIDQYSIRLAEKAKVGRGRIDDGVIILVAIRDQRVRLEIGYGLEGAIPDITASRVRREAINPHFRNGDFFAGLDAGTDALIKLIDGEPLPPPRADPQSGFQGGNDAGDYGDYLVLLLVLVFVVGGILKAMLGRFIGSAAVGGIAGTAAWVITSLVGIGLAAGVAAFVISLVLGGGFGGRPGAWTGGRRRGGGWSGGGGGFGGGGSSGSWND
jgi:uncharacterized protein